MDKKEAIREYKLSHRPMGVFQILNKVNDKILIDASINVPGKINRHRFALNHGSHASKSLQAEWTELGGDAFEFETIEPVEPRDDPGYDYKADLEFLEDLWLEKLEPYGDKGYNERKKTREERLRMIAANRRS
ncbi:MAG: GIY-YIG nuclease family protein [Pyrinomonadaceae bacterium]